MSELWWLSSTSKVQLLLTLLKSDLFNFCALIFSHPIYFFYFIFFSPYLFKLLSFLSPLFITTSLFLLAFLSTTLTLSPQDNVASSSFIITACHAVVEGLRSKIDDTRVELLCLEDFEVFRIVFDTTPAVILDVDDDDDSSDVKGCQDEVLDPLAASLQCSEKFLARELGVEDSGDSGAPDQLQEKFDVVDTMGEEEKRLEAFLEELDEFDGTVVTTRTLEEEAVKKIEKQEEDKYQQQQQVVTNGSEAGAGNYRKSQIAVEEVELGSDKGRHTKDITGVEVKVKDSQRAADENVDSQDKNSSFLSVESSRALEYINLGSYGSMRREKDWKRTLAGKLFEERHLNNTSGSSEGMDLLWETYEMESSKTKFKNDTKEKEKEKKNNNKNKKKHDQMAMKRCYPLKKEPQEKEEKEQEDDDDDDEDYDGSDESNGQLCCLQALKFSTGKMNMGMGRPSLVRISKAIKGFGWLHHVSSRHSKKVHIGDRF